MKGFIAVAWLVLGIAFTACGGGDEPTFNADVAPILHAHCAECHRPGAVGAFDLLSYEDIAETPGGAEELAAAVVDGSMPPWLPGDGDVPLAGREIDLTAEQVDTLVAWVDAGSPEDSGTPPAPPGFSSVWALGDPDLVLGLEDDFVVPATGPEIFRTFVIPLGSDAPLALRAIDLRPADSQPVVHHATIVVDDTGAARALDAASAEAGFEGMEAGFSPGDLFIGWAPGRRPSDLGAGVVWEVPPQSDVLIQFHLRPAGEATPLQPELGLYLADEPGRPTATLHLGNTTFELPPGEVTAVTDSMVVPADVAAVSVFPHAHLLAASVDVRAALPDGTKLTLLSIPRWDFDWQDEYFFETPVRLPVGTVLSMETTFDRSRRNPKSPAGPVVWGPRSTDEMADVWIRVTGDDGPTMETVRAETYRANIDQLVAGYLARLERGLGGFTEAARIGHIYVGDGRFAEALEYLDAALTHGETAIAWHNRGIALVETGDVVAAVESFERSVTLDPSLAPAWEGLGTARGLDGDVDGAIAAYHTALQERPGMAIASLNLGLLLAGQGSTESAEQAVRGGLAAHPDDPDLHVALARLLATRGEAAAARGHVAAALEIDPGHPGALELAEVLDRAP